MLQDRQIKTLMLLHELEEALAALYTILAKAFPEHEALWSQLITEEHEHATAVQGLYKLTYKGKALFDEGTIKPEGVQSIIDYIAGVADAAPRGTYSEVQILSIALDIEKSLIEKKLFAHFEVSPEYAELLDTLQEGSEAHVRIVEKELALISQRKKSESSKRMK